MLAYIFICKLFTFVSIYNISFIKMNTHEPILKKKKKKITRDLLLTRIREFDIWYFFSLSR